MAEIESHPQDVVKSKKKSGKGERPGKEKVKAAVTEEMEVDYISTAGYATASGEDMLEVEPAIIKNVQVEVVSSMPGKTSSTVPQKTSNTTIEKTSGTIADVTDDTIADVTDDIEDSYSVTSRGSSVSDGSVKSRGRREPVVEEMEIPTLHKEVESCPEIETLPDIVASAADEGSISSGGSVEYSRTQLTETEEVIETEVEETVTMMIVGVVTNPGESVEDVVSLQDAVQRGILDLTQGLYYNSKTCQKIAMMEAMSKGWVKMGTAKVSKSEERVKSMGIITIRTTRETMPYTVKAAMNTLAGEMVSLDEAAALNMLNPSSGTYKDLKTGAVMLIGDAVDKKLVEIEYDPKATGTVNEEVLKTYAVHAVVDQKQKAKIPFHEAVSRGIIDKKTSEYVNNVTFSKISAEEAIQKGFIKATITDNPKELSLDQIGNKTAERGAEAIRKKLLNPLKALKGFKK